VIHGEVLIEGRRYDLANLTLGDLEWLETELDLPIDQIDLGSVKAMVRVVYLLKRQDNDAFTLEEARGLRLSIFNEPEPEPEPDVKPGAGKRPTRRAAK
jgi:hypothetical protein